jgi:hypothetical protein
MMRPQPSIFSTVPSSHLRGIGLNLMAASRQRRRLWPAVLLSLGWSPELLAVLAHDCGGGFQANADGTALIKPLNVG